MKTQCSPITSSNFMQDTAFRLVYSHIHRYADHKGYVWDGVTVNPGTGVMSFKTIATETGLSYYRVRRCMAALVDMGVITVERHKCCAIVTIADVQEKRPGTRRQECNTDAAESAEATGFQVMTRAQRRRLAREAAKAAKTARYNTEKGRSRGLSERNVPVISSSLPGATAQRMCGWQAPGQTGTQPSECRRPV